MCVLLLHIYVQIPQDSATLVVIPILPGFNLCNKEMGKFMRSIIPDKRHIGESLWCRSKVNVGI